MHRGGGWPPAYCDKYGIYLLPQRVFQHAYLTGSTQDVALSWKGSLLAPPTDASVRTAVELDAEALKRNRLLYSIRLDDDRAYPIVTYQYAVIPKRHCNRQAIARLLKLVKKMYAARDEYAKSVGYCLLTPELRAWVVARLNRLAAAR